MSVTVYYLRRRHIGFVIDEQQRIQVFLKGHVEKAYRNVVAIHELMPAQFDERTYYNANTRQLFLDGLALFELQLWFTKHYTGPPPGTESASRKFSRAFDDFFAGGSMESAVTLARCAHAGVVGMQLPGELGYFSSAIVKVHPEVFAAYRRGEFGNVAEIVLD